MSLKIYDYVTFFLLFLVWTPIKTKDGKRILGKMKRGFRLVKKVERFIRSFHIDVRVTMVAK